MDQDTINRLGRDLYEAEASGAPLEPLSERHHFDVAEAYAIQEAYARLRVGDGTRLVARKIGATSKAIQELFNIDTPDYGRIFEDMVVPDGGEVALDELIAPMVEPEIAFLLAADLAGPGVTRDDVLSATRHVLPCLEIIDSRIRDWEIAFADTVADNGSSARCVFGSSRHHPAAVDLAAERVRFLRDGQEIETATGKAVLGHPADAVAWLANAIGEFDATLQAGQYVLSGSMTSASKASPEESYEAVFDSLGRVACSFV